MNKKGFTLVELLAVIAILAILVLIAMPNVLGMFNSSKRNTFLTEVKSTLKQVGTDYVSDSITGYSANGYIYTNEANYTSYGFTAKSGVTPKELNLDTSKKYIIDVNANGQIVKAQIWDGSFCYDAEAASGSEIKYNEVVDGNVADGQGTCVTN